MKLLDQLAACKGQFGREAALQAEQVLARVARARFEQAEDLIRLHETLLFLRAYPQSSRVARAADAILFSFAGRLRGTDPGPFDDPIVSGIAGTTVSTNFSREFALSLVSRHGDAIQIDWDDFANPDRLGVVLGDLMPWAYEEYAVEPHVDWRTWMKQAGRDARWLVDNVDASTYELLEIPLQWRIDSRSSRSSLRLPRKTLFYHSGPLMKRAGVSIESEFATPPIKLQRLGSARARTALAVIVDASAVRYRELYGFQHPDENGVYHADLARGVELVFFGAAPAKRLPLRAYHCGMFFKNGVPMGYVETLSLFERCEVGFNLYYTFREGETAWLYARILKLLREQLGVTCFSIDPYQLGHDNDEAIESGAFWFYYKLGFRPADRKTARLALEEAQKIAARPGYRSSTATLRRLSTAPLFYKTTSDGLNAQDWARFSIHKLSLNWPHAESQRFLKAAARLKRTPAGEIGYLRWLQRQPALRRQVVDAARG